MQFIYVIEIQFISVIEINFYLKSYFGAFNIQNDKKNRHEIFLLKLYCNKISSMINNKYTFP